VTEHREAFQAELAQCGLKDTEKLTIARDTPFKQSGELWQDDFFLMVISTYMKASMCPAADTYARRRAYH